MSKEERLIALVAAAALVAVSVLGLLAANIGERVEFVGPRYGVPTRPMPVPPRPVVPPEAPVPPLIPDEGAQTACEAAGGRWNECGSACRGAPPGTACIMLCVPMCECASDDQCPADQACEFKIDDVGICQ